MAKLTSHLPTGSGLEVYDSFDQWLEDANRGAPGFTLGGTAIAALLNVSPYKGPWDVWRSAHRKDPRRKANAAQAAGMYWEDKVATWYSETKGVRLKRPVCRVSHPTETWLRTSPDGFSCDGLIEIKLRRSRSGFGRDGTVIERATPDALRVLPGDVLAQIYANLLASGLPACDFIGAFTLHDIRVYTIVADEAYQDRLLNIVGEWREKHLVGGKEPVYDHSEACKRTVIERRSSSSAVREATEPESVLALRYTELAALEKSSKAGKKAVFSELADMMSDARTITIPNQAGGTGRFTIGSNNSPKVTNLP